MTMDGIHQLLDLLARGIIGSAGIPAGSVQHALNQLHRILAIELVQLPPLPLGIEWCGQRLTAGEDEPRIAHLQQVLAQCEHGVQRLARLVRQGLRRLLLYERWQENALHVVHDQQGRLLPQRTFNFPDRFVEIACR
jgi:hypothetical protein